MPAKLDQCGRTSGPRLLRMREAADVLAVSIRTAWRLAAAGELEVVKIGRASRVTENSVRALIDRGGAK